MAIINTIILNRAFQTLETHDPGKLAGTFGRYHMAVTWSYKGKNSQPSHPLNYRYREEEEGLEEEEIQQRVVRARCGKFTPATKTAGQLQNICHLSKAVCK